VPDASFLRIVAFQPGEATSASDADLRDKCVPRLAELEGIVDVWAGRHGSGDDQSRVLISTWLVDPEADPSGPPDVAALRALGARISTIDEVEQFALSIHARFERVDPPRILRLFRGRVRERELDAYVEVARAGMLADSVNNRGLIAFALGRQLPDAFTTVSVWTDWTAIEMATGGNVRQPFSTRNSERLSDFQVTHYEALPDAPDRGQHRSTAE
jgi:hypothetical protein